VIQRLRQALAQRQKVVNTAEGLIPAAVLLPLFYEDGEYHLLFTRRTEKVSTHKGQISFPGGAFEEEDITLLNTALRECAEEIDLSPDDVEIIGELDDIPTVASSYNISPFVGVIPCPYDFRPDPLEVAALIEVPISVLLAPGCWSREPETWRGQLITTYYYRYQDEIIWGASARILRRFLDIWTSLDENQGEEKG